MRSRAGRVLADYSNSVTGSRSSRMYIGRPLPLGNVFDGSMPIAWYSVLSSCGTRVGPVVRVFAAGAGGADRLAHLQAAAGDQRAHGRRPVVAAAVVAVDLRRAAELAPHHRHHVVLHAAVVQVLDQVGHAAIHLGSCCRSVLKLLLCVSQPPIGQRHAADARLDQPAGRQELLDALVAVAAARLLVVQVERLAHRARTRSCRRRGLLKVSRPFIVPLASMSRRTSSKPLSSALRSSWRLDVDAAGQAQVGHARAARRERPVGDAEVARLGARRHAAQADERRDVRRAGRAASTPRSRTTGGAAVRFWFSL